MFINLVKLTCLKKIIPFFFLFVFALLTGCSKTKEVAALVLQDRGQDFKHVKTYPTLRVPKEIHCDSSSKTYQIPDGNIEGGSSSNG